MERIVTVNSDSSNPVRRRAVKWEWKTIIWTFFHKSCRHNFTNSLKISRGLTRMKHKTNNKEEDMNKNKMIKNLKIFQHLKSKWKRRKRRQDLNKLFQHKEKMNEVIHEKIDMIRKKLEVWEEIKKCCLESRRWCREIKRREWGTEKMKWWAFPLQNCTATSTMLGASKKATVLLLVLRGEALWN